MAFEKVTSGYMRDELKRLIQAEEEGLENLDDEMSRLEESRTALIDNLHNLEEALRKV